MIKERSRAQCFPPMDHGGCETVVRLGSQGVGRILCGNKFYPSGSHRLFEPPLVLHTAVPKSYPSRPPYDAPPHTLANLANIPSGGNTLSVRPSQVRGNSGKGASAPATTSSTLGLGGLSPISDTAPTTISFQRATGSPRDTVPPCLRHSRTPSHRLHRRHRHRPQGDRPLRLQRPSSPRQQYSRLHTTAHLSTRPPTKPGNRISNIGALQAIAHTGKWPSAGRPVGRTPWHAVGNRTPTAPGCPTHVAPRHALSGLRGCSSCGRRPRMSVSPRFLAPDSISLPAGYLIHE